jgi:glycerate dehydrogenase
MERIVFLDRDAIRANLRRPAFEHTWTEYATTRPEQLKERFEGATIAITNRMYLRGPHLPSTLRLIAMCATGYECIDLQACRDRHVAVCNVRDWSVSVPEHVFAMALALRRNLLGYNASIRQGEWSQSKSYCILKEPIGHTLSSSTLGIVGYGALGRAVAKIGRAFDMHVLIAERKGAAESRPDRVPFRDLLRRSDVVVLLCPLTPETRGLIGAEEISLMKPDALLINCARGGIVVEADLADALIGQRIGGAGVDVLEAEPPSPDNPLLRLRLDNLIITPHVAWASRESLENLAEQLIQNIEAFVRGEPRHLVT